MRVSFTVLPDRVAGDSYPINPLTNIRQAVPPPPSAHRDFLAAGGWPYATARQPAYLTAAISATVFQLESSGLLDALDFLHLSAGTVASALINQVRGKPPAVVIGGVTADGGAILTDGQGGHFTASLAGAGQYRATSSSFFTWLTEDPPADHATNPIVTGDGVTLSRNPGSPFYQAAINANETSIPGLGISGADWRAGLVLGQRISNMMEITLDETTFSIAVSTERVPNSLSVGRPRGASQTNFTQQKFTAFGGGRYLTATEVSTLRFILANHAAALRRYA